MTFSAKTFQARTFPARTFPAKTLLAAAALGLGLAAAPASAQVLGFDRGDAYGRASGYNEDGTLNVFGAHIEPRPARGGVLGIVTAPVDAVTTGVFGGRGPGYGAGY